MRIIIILAFMLMACNPKTCPQKRVFSNGEKAVFVKTGEEVRIIEIWQNIGDSCFSGRYTIRFVDGTQVLVDQNELQEARK